MTSLEKYVWEIYIKDKPNSEDKMFFEQESYSKFFAKKIMEEGKLYKSFELYLEDLIDELTEAFTIDLNHSWREHAWIFSIGYDVATDILDHILFEQENKKWN